MTQPYVPIQDDACSNLFSQFIKYPDEQILFCDPPIIKHGFTSYFKIAVLVSNMVAMYASLFVVEESKQVLTILVGLGVWLILVWLLLALFKWSFFGYKIITNQRAAIVIPKTRFLICTAGIQSAYFKPLLEQFTNGDFTVREKWYSMKINYLASLAYNKDENFESERGGSATFYSTNQILRFKVANIQLLEAILVSALKTILYDSKFEKDIKNFEIRIIGDSPPTLYSRWTCGTFLYCVIWPLFIGMGFYLWLFFSLPDSVYIAYICNLVLFVFLLGVALVREGVSNSTLSTPILIGYFHDDEFVE